MTWNQLQRICVICDTEDSQPKPVVLEQLLLLVNSPTKRKTTPLHFVALGTNLTLARWLLQHGAEFFQNEDDENPLHWACKSGHLPMIKLFLSHMSLCEIIETDYNNQSPLNWALEYKNYKAAKLLRTTISQKRKTRNKKRRSYSFTSLCF